MTLDEMIELFEYDINAVRDPATHTDLGAFLRLHSLVPVEDRIISDAQHDQIWLSTDPSKLAAVATKEDILFLRNSGVFYDNECESLSMFR